MKRRSQPKRRTPVRARNDARAERRRAEAFGPQASYCRSAPCCVCKASPPSIPHHDPTRAAGGLDDSTVPLCIECHTMVHAMGRKSFNRAYQVDLAGVARELAKRLAEE